MSPYIIIISSDGGATSLLYAEIFSPLSAHHTVRGKGFEGTTEIYIEHMHICIRREPPLGDIRKLRNRILDRRLIHPLVS